MIEWLLNKLGYEKRKPELKRKPYQLHVERELTPLMLKEFTENIVWAEIRDTFLERIELFRDDMEKATTLDEIRQYQGAVQEARFITMFPQMMLERCQAEQTKKDKEDSD
jgi:hypothetical protein